MIGAHQVAVQQYHLFLAQGHRIPPAGLRPPVAGGLNYRFDAAPQVNLPSGCAMGALS
jgi:hypothetical protein